MERAAAAADCAAAPGISTQNKHKSPNHKVAIRRPPVQTHGSRTCLASLSASMSNLSLISLSLEMAASLVDCTSDLTLSPTAPAASLAADLASLPADDATCLASELDDDTASLMLSRTSAAAELTASPAPERGLDSASDASGEMSEVARTAAAAATPIRRAAAAGFSAAMVGERVETADRRVAGAAKVGVHGTNAMMEVSKGGGRQGCADL